MRILKVVHLNRLSLKQPNKRFHSLDKIKLCNLLIKIGQIRPNNQTRLLELVKNLLQLLSLVSAGLLVD